MERSDCMRLRNVKNAKEILKASKYFVIEPMNNKSKWKEIFKNDNPIMLEVGMGKGDFIVGMAKKHPEWNFIGVEAQESVLVRAIEKLENEELDNVRVINIYAEALGELFDCEIDTLFLNFSDPWPKTRHHKRRLTYETHLKVYDNLFKGDAKLELKTDNDGLFQDSLVYLSQYGYVLDEVILDLKSSGKDNVETEYEEKFSSLGFKIKYVKAHKNNTFLNL